MQQHYALTIRFLLQQLQPATVCIVGQTLRWNRPNQACQEGRYVSGLESGARFGSFGRSVVKPVCHDHNRSSTTSRFAYVVGAEQAERKHVTTIERIDSRC